MYKPRFKVVFSNERILSPSGLGIVGGMLAKSDFVKRCNRIPVDKKRSEPQIKNGDILLTYTQCGQLKREVSKARLAVIAEFARGLLDGAGIMTPGDYLNPIAFLNCYGKNVFTSG